jgi:hypothetical protein
MARSTGRRYTADIKRRTTLETPSGRRYDLTPRAAAQAREPSPRIVEKAKIFLRQNAARRGSARLPGVACGSPLIFVSGMASLPLQQVTNLQRDACPKSDSTQR